VDAPIFGEWVKRRRQALHLTQHQLAQSVYCSIEAVRKIEQNARRPSQTMAERLGECLAVAEVERPLFVRAARGEMPTSRLSAPETPMAVVQWSDDRDPGRPPIPPTRLVGRAADVGQVCALVQRPGCRLVTLTGPPGVGKTRLAIEVAAGLHASFVDGVYFIPLAALRESDLILPRIAQSLHLSPRHGESALARLIRRFDGRSALLVLDNFEQLLTGASSLAALVMALPDLKLLVTSRSPLRLSGEHRFVVQPLRVPDVRTATELLDLDAAIADYPGVELLVERTLSAGSQVSPEPANVRALATVCARLDGLPLALELAAARMSVFTPLDLLQRINDRFSLLTAGAADLPARQRTLLHAVDWSHELLERSQQQLLARLAVFLGGFTLDAVEETCGVQGESRSDLFADLAVLVDSNLVRRVDGTSGTVRFDMLEIIREYALRKLHASGEQEMLRRWHAEYFLSLAEHAESRWDRVDESVLLKKFLAEHDNLREVLRWAIAHEQSAFALRFNAALYGYWLYMADLTDARRWVELALSLAASHPSPLLVADTAKVRNVLGYALAVLGDPSAARAQFEQAEREYRELSDERLMAWSLRGCGFTYMIGGDTARARSFFQRSLAMTFAIHDDWGLAWSMFDLGYTALTEGDLSGALQLLGEAWLRCRAQGIMFGQFRALLALGFAHLQHDELAEAGARYVEALALAREVAFRQYTPDGLEGAARVALMQGQAVRAATLFAAAHTSRTTTGLARWPLFQNTHEGCLEMLRDQLDGEAWNYGLECGGAACVGRCNRVRIRELGGTDLRGARRVSVALTTFDCGGRDLHRLSWPWADMR
jgi:predicted ATPase/transcriptional regulator with XRE-family HTH domain